MSTATRSTSPDQAWAATIALLATHQMEEVAFSIGEWKGRVGSTGWPRIDRHIDNTPLCRPSLAPRVGTVAAQAAGAALLHAATRRSPLATRVVTTALCSGWAGAFVTHIAISARTRSAMPGLATSLVPGLPGAVWTIRYIWS